jgi:hypothetical protein
MQLREWWVKRILKQFKDEAEAMKKTSKTQ